MHVDRKLPRPNAGCRERRRKTIAARCNRPRSFRPLIFELLEVREMLAGEAVKWAIELCRAEEQQATDFGGMTEQQRQQRMQEIEQTCTGRVVHDALKQKIQPEDDQRKQRWDNFRESNRWIKAITERLKRGQTIDDHTKNQAKDALINYVCTEAEGTDCRERVQPAISFAFDKMQERPESFSDFNSVQTILLGMVNRNIDDFSGAANGVLSDGAGAWDNASKYGAMQNQAGAVFLPGQQVNHGSDALPSPAQSQAVDPPSPGAERIDTPNGSVTLDRFDVVGSVGRGDFSGGGDGLSFSSNSGSLSASWDAATGQSSVQFSINASGNYNEPGVACRGQGQVSSSSGSVAVAQGKINIQGAFGGTIPGSCEIELFDGSTFTEIANVSITQGQFSGTIDPQFRFASGGFTASWSSTAGPSGAISGDWRAKINRESFDDSVEIVLTQEVLGKRFAIAAALATGDSPALYSTAEGGQIQFDIQNIGSDVSVTDNVGLGAPVAGDWDGNGLTTFGVFNDGVWNLDTDGNAGGLEQTIQFGASGDAPLVGDWDGDGADDLGVYNNGVWTMRAADGSTTQVNFDFDDVISALGGPPAQQGTNSLVGLQGSPVVPIVGDWDGDGIDDLGFYQTDSFFLRSSDETVTFFQFFGPRPDFGEPNVIPVIGDWNGDGADEIGTYHMGEWQFDLDGRGAPAERVLQFGGPANFPLAGFWTDRFFDEHRFNSTNDPQKIHDLSTIESYIWVGEDFEIGDVDVTVNISHFWDADLDAYLIAPDGTRVELFTDIGGSGRDVVTNLDDEAGVSIVDGSAPFFGYFRPEGSLAALDGRSARGLWTLEITDDEELIDGSLNNWALTVKSANTPPSAAPLADQSIGLDGPVSVTASAVDSETPLGDLRYGIDVAPPAATIDPVTGEFVWTPTEADVGHHIVSLRVTDDASAPLSDYVMFRITVDGSAAPVVETVGNRIAIQDQQLAFTVAATDPNPEDSLSYSLGPGAPPGAAIDPNTGHFSWTPAAAQTPGIYSVEIIVADDSPMLRSTSHSVTVTAFPPGANLNRNPINPVDIDGDFFVAPNDVLFLINQIISGGARPLPPPPDPQNAPPPFLDPTDDGFLATDDALMVINFILNPLLQSPLPPPAAEGEFVNLAWIAVPPVEQQFDVAAGVARVDSQDADALFARYANSTDAHVRLPADSAGQSLPLRLSLPLAHPPRREFLDSFDAIWSDLDPHALHTNDIAADVP